MPTQSLEQAHLCLRLGIEVKEPWSSKGQTLGAAKAEQQQGSGSQGPLSPFRDPPYYMDLTPPAPGSWRKRGFGPENLQAWLELNISPLSFTHPSCRWKAEEACRS